MKTRGQKEMEVWRNQWLPRTGAGKEAPLGGDSPPRKMTGAALYQVQRRTHLLGRDTLWFCIVPGVTQDEEQMTSFCAVKHRR